MVSLLPLPEQQFFGTGGLPLSLGTVATYQPGTSVFKNTWQDSAGTILNTNPIVLNADGRAIIYGSGTYRFVVSDNLGSLVYDQLSQSPDNLPSLTVTGAITTSSISSTTGVIGGVNFTGAGLSTAGPISATTITASAGMIASGLDAGGMQWRAPFGTIGAGFRNDNSNFFLLSTPIGSPLGVFNGFRPLRYNLVTGQLFLDETGVGLVTGGTITTLKTITGGNVTATSQLTAAGLTVTGAASIGAVVFPGGGGLNTNGTVNAFGLLNTGDVVANIGTVGGVTFPGGGAMNGVGAVNFAGTTTSFGYATRNGVAGPYSGNFFNFLWGPPSLACIIDNVFVGTVNLVSDKHFKKDIKPIPDDALTRINKLETVSYRYQDKSIFKDDGVIREGLIAQNVMDHIPSGVEDVDDRHSPLTLNLTPIIAVMVKAVQELSAKVTLLEKGL